jgi:hypothetical protein
VSLEKHEGKDAGENLEATRWGFAARNHGVHPKTILICAHKLEAMLVAA